MNSGIIIPGSLNLAVNPLAHKPGDMIRCLNVENDQFGAKKKRPGYVTYLGTVGASIDSLWSWQLDNGTQFFNYAAAGGSVFYSTQGTGAWTICGNGTITSGNPVFHAISENTMLITERNGTTRHTTNGTSFTDTSAAPAGQGMVDYQNRIYIIGTASTMFWSNAGTPTNWVNDSSSINIPGPGRLHNAVKVSDRIVTGKNSGVMHRWDGYNLYDLSTNLSPSSAQSVASVEGYKFYLNRQGIFGFDGNKPELVSNAIEKVIYNDANEGIIGTTFNNAPGICHRYEYYCSIGTVTDDLTDVTVPNAIAVYDYQADDWWLDTFNNRPTTFGTYQDASGDIQMTFGDPTGQCYTFGGTARADNTAPIEVAMEGVIHMNTLQDKKWNWFRAIFNPGCRAQVRVAFSDTFTKAAKQWITIGQAFDGVFEKHFSSGSRGRFLFWQISEASTEVRFHFYGFEYDADVIQR